MIKFCKSREICTATKCFTSQQFNSPLAFEQFFYSTLKIDWLFSNQMADSLWKSRPEFIPSIVVYSIAFVVSLAIFIVKNQTTNLTSASYTCHCTIYIVNREQKHSTTLTSSLVHNIWSFTVRPITVKSLSDHSI